MIVWYGPKWHRRQNLSRHQRERSHRQSHDSRLLPAAGGTGGVIFGNVGQWAAAGAVGGAVGSPTQALLQGLFQPNLRSHRISNSLAAAKKGYEPVGWK